MPAREGLVKFVVTLAAVIAGTSGAHAQAQQAGQGGCIADALGQIFCSPPGGGIQKNAIGQIFCGTGQCVSDALGQIVCSSQPGGYATKDLLGQVVCTGGCQQGSTWKCQRPR
jgi:hypothetical protein